MTEHAKDPLPEESEQPPQPPDDTSETLETPRRRLPNIGDKPVGSPWKRRGKIGMLVSGTVFIAAAASFRFLQHNLPGPQPVYVQPTIKSLAALATEKGFPKACLGPLYTGPFEDDPSHNPNIEKQVCTYSGHHTGEPEPIEPCEVIISRDVWADTYHFSVNVVNDVGDKSTLIPLGTDAKFSEIPASPDVPAACVQENISYS